MFWTLAVLLLLGSYAIRGFVPVVIFLALAGILLRLVGERRRRLRLSTVTGAARKPR